MWERLVPGKPTATAVSNQVTVPTNEVAPGQNQRPRQPTIVDAVATYVYGMIKMIVQSLIVLTVAVAAYFVVSD